METCPCYNDSIIDCLFTEFKNIQFQRDEIEKKVTLLPEDTELFSSLKLQLAKLSVDMDSVSGDIKTRLQQLDHDPNCAWITAY